MPPVFKKRMEAYDHRNVCDKHYLSELRKNEINLNVTSAVL